MSPRAWLLPLALLATPLAQAAECELQLGHGWPPATGNHGDAVEGLLVADAAPAMHLTWLPKRGAESALMLVQPADGGDWTLRYARPPERVDQWDTGAGGMKRVLLVDQQPEVLEVPMPAALAARLVAGWQRTLQAGVPADRAAEFHDDEVLSLVIGGERYSGLEPGCGAGELLVEQAEDLVKTADEEDADDRAERWQDLQRDLDELDEVLREASYGDQAAAG
ncbi:hypothetical protein [Lysobacter sp. F6437]|uniref:hypothetical protein n=1 Tax=Lysobacter sp. F6437 TaxID=3459296 RepID=UPI00403E346D